MNEELKQIKKAYKAQKTGKVTENEIKSPECVKINYIGIFSNKEGEVIMHELELKKGQKLN